MRTQKPYPSLDDQILACIEASKNLEEAATLDDFQLRTVGTDLILVNLKTSQSFALYDTDNEPLDQDDPCQFPARLPRKADSATHNAAAMLKVLAHRLIGWLAARHIHTSHGAG
jgi:hypothetical protein